MSKEEYAPCPFCGKKITDADTPIQINQIGFSDPEIRCKKHTYLMDLKTWNERVGTTQGTK